MNDDVPVIAGHVNVLNALEAEFTDASVLSTVLLERGVCGLGRPDSVVSISMARDILLDRETEPDLSDRIWATLVRHYRRRPRRWRPIVIWMMLPNLRVITSRLYRSWWRRVDVQDIQSDVIVGFLEELRRTDPDSDALGANLWWRTFNHAHQACVRLAAERPAADLDVVAARATDHSVDPSADHDHHSAAVRATVDVPYDAVAVEGARLGSLARRLGLRDRVLRHGTGAAA